MAEQRNEDILRELRAAVDGLRNRPNLGEEAPAPAAWDEAASRLGGLEERVRTEVAARRSAFVEPRALDPCPPSEPPPSVRRESPIDFRTDYGLGELIAYEDAEFVRNVYRALLHREPEPGGFAIFHGLLNSGTSKVEVVAMVSGSIEGRRVGVRVRGLRFASAMQTVRRLPAVGRIFAVAQLVWSLPWLLQRLERQERELARSERQLRETIDAVWSFAYERSTRSFDAIDALERDKASRGSAMALTGRMATLQRDVAERAAREMVQRTALREDLLRLADSTLSASDALAARFDASFTRKRIEAVLAEDDHELDSFYAAFEETFRGSLEEIRKRMEVYVPIVKEACADSAAAPILDVGCGRGEFLEVLRESGCAARGVDLNVEMVERCRSLGLEVEQGEMIAYLRSLESDSLGGVTGMHVIEHVSPRSMIQLLDETLRVLQPGGIAIFETPNPENLIVGACNFWYDPTHQRPLAPEPTKATFALRGFADVRILPLHPFPVEAHLPIRESDLRDRLNHLLYGPQDYAVIAFKPKKVARP